MQTQQTFVFPQEGPCFVNYFQFALGLQHWNKKSLLCKSIKHYQAYCYWYLDLAAICSPREQGGGEREKQRERKFFQRSEIVNVVRRGFLGEGGVWGGGGGGGSPHLGGPSNSDRVGRGAGELETDHIGSCRGNSQSIAHVYLQPSRRFCLYRFPPFSCFLCMEQWLCQSPRPKALYSSPWIPHSTVTKALPIGVMNFKEFQLQRFKVDTETHFFSFSKKSK